MFSSLSSVVEHRLHTAGVVGSNPTASTIFKRRCFRCLLIMTSRFRLRDSGDGKGLNHISDQNWPSDKNLLFGFWILLPGPIHVCVSLDLVNWKGVINNPSRISLEYLGFSGNFNFQKLIRPLMSKVLHPLTCCRRRRRCKQAVEPRWPRRKVGSAHGLKDRFCQLFGEPFSHHLA